MSSSVSERRPLPIPERDAPAEGRMPVAAAGEGDLSRLLAEGAADIGARFPASLVRKGFEVRVPAGVSAEAPRWPWLLLTADAAPAVRVEPPGAGRWQGRDAGEAGHRGALRLEPGARALVGDPASGDAVELAREADETWTWRELPWGVAEARAALAAIPLPAEAVDPALLDGARTAVEAALRLGRLVRTAPAGRPADLLAERRAWLAWREARLGPAVGLWCAVAAERAVAAARAILDGLLPGGEASGAAWAGGVLSAAGEARLAEAARLRLEVEDAAALDDRWIDWDGAVALLDRRLDRVALDSGRAEAWRRFGPAGLVEG